MEQANVHQLLAKRGFEQQDVNAAPKGQTTDRAIVEQLAEGDVTRPIRHHNPSEFSARAYTDSYIMLKAWIDDSLDIYKNELQKVLFPLFVHCYLDLMASGDVSEGKRFFEKLSTDHPPRFSSELTRLSSLTSPLHLQENELVQAYRQNKYTLTLTPYAFQLLMTFIHEKKLMLLIKLLNQYIKILAIPAGQSTTPDLSAISSATPSSVSASSSAMPSSTSNIVHSFTRDILWGSLAPDTQLQAASDERRKRKNRKWAQWTPEDDTEAVERRQQLMQEREDTGVAAFAPTRDRIPIESPGNSTAMITEHTLQMEIDSLMDLRYRTSLSRTQLPSACCYTLQNTHDSLSAVGFSSDSQLLATGYTQSFIHVHSLKGERLRALRRGQELPDVSGFLEEDSHIYDLSKYREIAGSATKKLIGHSGPVYGLSFSPDQRLLMSCSQDGTARAWSTDAFTNLVAYKGHNYPIWDIDCAPHMPYFATASHDRTARLWRYDYISPLRIYAGHLSDVDSVKFHVNSNYLATGSSDKTVRLWDNLSGKVVQLLQGHDGAVRSLAFSPDGKLLASAGDDGKVCLWDLSMGKLMKEMVGAHEDTVYALAFSQEGSLLTSGSRDQTVKIWDAKRIPSATSADDSGQDLLATWTTKFTPVFSLQYTKRNVLLVSGPFEGGKH